MKRMLAVAVAAACASSAVLAQDAAPAAPAEGNLMMRVRAVYIDPANKSDPVGGSGASDRIHVSTKTIPEVDFTYFVTPSLAAELILTYPQKHDVTLDGGKIGTFKHLPPTLTLQYHFMPTGAIRPYVGAGVNYTRISNVSLGGLDLERNSFGGAMQAGVDFKIGANSYINLDVKKVYIGADVKAGGDKISHVDVDPVLIGVGYGFKF